MIGDLQSEWGVPQYPQEYRITIKVAEERDAQPARTAAIDDVAAERAAGSQAPALTDTGPRREKAPGLAAIADSPGPREPSPGKRRRGRRRRRGGGGGQS